MARANAEEILTDIFVCPPFPAPQRDKVEAYREAGAKGGRERIWRYARLWPAFPLGRDAGGVGFLGSSVARIFTAIGRVGSGERRPALGRIHTNDRRLWWCPWGTSVAQLQNAEVVRTA
jgi:hypothetical protein